MDISSACFRYWGKADPEYPGGPKWHPLVYHSLDVAACGQVLFCRQPAWLNNLARLSGFEPAALSPWLVFLLAIHDLGKFGDGFQSLRSDLQQDLQGRVANVAYDVRHDSLGYAVVMENLPQWLECSRTRVYAVISANADTNVLGASLVMSCSPVCSRSTSALLNVQILNVETLNVKTLSRGAGTMGPCLRYCSKSGMVRSLFSLSTTPSEPTPCLQR